MRIFILVMFILALGSLGCCEKPQHVKIVKLFKVGEVVCHRSNLNQKMIVIHGDSIFRDYSVGYVKNDGESKFESFYEYELTKCD